MNEVVDLKELHIQGWLCYDSDGLIAVKDKKSEGAYYAHSIQETIEDFVSKQVDHYEDDSLGGKRVVIPNVAMRMYATNKSCTLEEATGTVVAYLYGDIHSDIGYEGYSEWTITGYYCKEFMIGGHDLTKEFDSYINKYIHLVIECKE